MTELHTIVALERAVGARTREELTELYRKAQHAPTFSGSTREMVSFTEEIPSEPAETILPEMTAAQLFQRMRKILPEAWDLMATRDRSNMDAKADIVVDGEVLAEGVPVSTLLALEKHLVNMRTVVKAMPVRDPSKIWTYDSDQGFSRAPAVTKVRTRKVPRGATLYEATPQHPAQVQAYSADEPIGQYFSVEFSGAMSTQDRETLVDRLNTHIDAVKAARTEANRTEVTNLHIGAELLDNIFVR